MDAERHAIVTKRVAEGYVWQRHLTAFLNSKGIPAEMVEGGKVQKMPTTKPFAGENGDIWVPRIPVTPEERGAFIPVECKTTRFPITVPREFKFDPAMVDGKFGWDNKKVKARVVVVLSQDNQGMMWLSVKESRSRWVVERRFDPETQLMKDYYLAHLRWWYPVEELVEALKAELGAK